MCWSFSLPAPGYTQNLSSLTPSSSTNQVVLGTHSTEITHPLSLYLKSLLDPMFFFLIFLFYFCSYQGTITGLMEWLYFTSSRWRRAQWHIGASFYRVMLIRPTVIAPTDLRIWYTGSPWPMQECFWMFHVKIWKAW